MSENSKTKEFAEYIRTLTIREFVNRIKENSYYLEGVEAITVKDIEILAEDEIL